MLLFYAFFDTWRAFSSMAFSTLLSLLLFSMHSLMLIGQEILMIVEPLWLALVLKQNILPLLIPHLSSFDYDGFLRTKVCSHPLLLLFIVTTRVPFILLTMMSSMNRLSTCRLIVIICYHLVHDALKLFSISFKDQFADIFTKSHPKECLHALVDNLKLVSHPPWGLRWVVNV